LDNQPTHIACEDSQGLSLTNIHKTFGDTIALNGVTFQIAEREILALLGPSGCGKSTVLAIVAGLEKPDQGEVCWDGVSLENTPTHQRGFGLMFQDFALFPHMNAFDNVAFGMWMKSASKEEIERRVEETLKLVGLPGFGARDVNTLSGGEAQRVALARSLAPYPRLLMLDEPLGSLDRNLRERLMVDLREILRLSQQTAVYVTHDQEEAFAVADRIVLMGAGRVAQIGTPQEIYKRPRTAFVARFLGLDNLIAGRISREDGREIVETPIGSFPIPRGETAGDQEQMAQQGEMQILLRPDAVYLNEGTGQTTIKGRLSQVSFRGSINRAVIKIGELTFGFDFPASAEMPPVGEEITLSFDAEEAIQVLE
jgi:ABC-type Fe3+/spermidine/putrescine transport system ATPase subunit